MPRQVAKRKGDDRPSKSSDGSLDDHSADEQDEKRKKQNPLEFPFPAHWSKTSGWSLVDVPANSDEYANVAEAFRSDNQTLGYYKTTIVKITRVQNPALWRQYQLRRSLILEKVGQRKLNENHLWHGTSLHIAQTISLQGFDFRVNPTHGRAYGDGIYFAPRPGLAISYGFQAPKVPATRKGAKGTAPATVAASAMASTSGLKASSGVCCAIYTLGVCGRATKGQPGYRRPPFIDPKDWSKGLFDSCYDRKNGDMVVIFENSQVYPEYIVYFKLQ